LERFQAEQAEIARLNAEAARIESERLVQIRLQAEREEQALWAAIEATRVE